MFSSKSTEHLAFLSRQLARLVPGQSLEPALRRLEEASPKQYAEDMAYLRKLLSGSAGEARAPGPNPYARMAMLMPAAGESKNDFFRHFVDYVQQSKVVFETYWAGVVGAVWYLAALAVVALIVAIIFGAYVVPSFSEMFSQFGASLPDLTEMVFTYGGAGIPLLAILVVVVVALVIWFVVLFHERIRSLSPLPRWPRWVPIIGQLSESYNLGLFLNFARTLLLSGVDAGRAVSAAAKAANQASDLSLDNLATTSGDIEPDSVMTELAVAAKLGHFNEEIEFQCDQYMGRLSLALVEARDRLALVLKFVMYLFVAVLIVAMYLPIFKMSSVI